MYSCWKMINPHSMVLPHLCFTVGTVLFGFGRVVGINNVFLTCGVISLGSSITTFGLVFYQPVCAPVVIWCISGIFWAPIPAPKTLPGFPRHLIINPLTPICTVWMVVFYVKNPPTSRCWKTIQFWLGFPPSLPHKDAQCVTHQWQ